MNRYEVIAMDKDGDVEWMDEFDTLHEAEIDAREAHRLHPGLIKRIIDLQTGEIVLWLAPQT